MSAGLLALLTLGLAILLRDQPQSEAPRQSDDPIADDAVSFRLSDHPSEVCALVACDHCARCDRLGEKPVFTAPLPGEGSRLVGYTRCSLEELEMSQGFHCYQWEELPTSIRETLGSYAKDRIFLQIEGDEE